MTESIGTPTRAAVVFSSRFGTTEKVARALSLGLLESGVDAECLSVDQMGSHSLKEFRLLCLGAPTEAFSAHRPMKDYLGRLKPDELKGMLGFAFDTRVDWRLSGSAAKYIEHVFDQNGVKKLAPRESAIVDTRKDGGTIAGAKLKDGEEERFHQIGVRLGRVALSTA